MNIILVACGGFLGAVFRALISDALSKHVLGTWIANILGALLLAWVFRSYIEHNISETLWLFLGIGFSGAFTTFSTFGSEVIQYLMAKRYTAAFLYSFISFGTALILVYVFLP